MADQQTTRRSFFTKAGAFLATFGIGAVSARAGNTPTLTAASTPAAATASATASASKSTSTSTSTRKPVSNPSKRAVGPIVKQDDIPLFSSSIVHGGLVYIAGKGAHFEGDIKAHTDHVLNELAEALEEAGSSMENVLKVNVYLHDIHEYTEMNEVYRGRFGEEPPVRTTVACFGGIPGDSLVEIDCIAALNG